MGIIYVPRSTISVPLATFYFIINIRFLYKYTRKRITQLANRENDLLCINLENVKGCGVCFFNLAPPKKIFHGRYYYNHDFIEVYMKRIDTLVVVYKRLLAPEVPQCRSLPRVYMIANKLMFINLM